MNQARRAAEKRIAAAESELEQSRLALSRALYRHEVGQSGRFPRSHTARVVTELLGPGLLDLLTGTAARMFRPRAVLLCAAAAGLLRSLLTRRSAS